ncbi:MAG: hypothetical protein KatS3mg035_1597 [Bacteroidia bacterium]|nr:MAG: hypothetical protein KatS3mg035_1597 [Bacteroidia bacterium]
MNKVYIISIMFFVLITNMLFAQSLTWSTLGNSDITPDNWLGTRNDAMLKDIIIKTDSKERMRVKGGGFFGIGLNNPNNIVHIHNPKNTPSVQEVILDTRGGGGGGTAPANTESPYFGSTGLQITNVESGTGTNDGLHIGLRNGMVQGIRLNAIFNLKENADMQFFTNNIHRMTIDRNGNIGIGTSIPQASLHLKKGSNSILFERQGYATFVIQQSAGSGLSITRQGSSTPDFYIDANGNIYAAKNGNMGIGTNCPTEKLVVNGKIKAKAEVFVNEIGGFCDYVFDENYKRMNYKQKEEYYKKNKHLFMLPSEKEILENGLPIVNTIKGITLNVEENSLDIIELYKRIEKLEEENNKLKQIINKK